MYGHLAQVQKNSNFAVPTGELAHLVERQVRNLKVAGSIPAFSTQSESVFDVVLVAKR